LECGQRYALEYYCNLQAQTIWRTGIGASQLKSDSLDSTDTEWLKYRAIMWPSGSTFAVLTFNLLMWRNGLAPNSIPKYIQQVEQVATLHSLFISGNCSTCFGWYFQPSSGAHTTVSTASGICHTVTAICRYRGRVGTDLSVLWVAVPTLPR
jgi:hypothetical protein